MTDPASAPLVFGSAPPGVICRPRPAAYAVIRDHAGRVAVVRGKAAFWLPGGGTLPGETPEETIPREVREELGRAARLLGKVGGAVQFFHAADDGCWYEMTATFFRAEFVSEPIEAAEHELLWLDASEEGALFFHACHAWAASTGH